MSLPEEGRWRIRRVPTERLDPAQRRGRKPQRWRLQRAAPRPYGGWYWATHDYFATQQGALREVARRTRPATTGARAAQAQANAVVSAFREFADELERAAAVVDSAVVPPEDFDRGWDAAMRAAAERIHLILKENTR